MFKGRVSSDTGIINVLIERGQRVIGLDLRGHGGSAGAASGPLPLRTALNDVYALLDHLSIDQAVIVGYSLGGLIAGQLLCDADPRLKAVVLGGIGHHIVDGERLDISAEHRPPELPAEATYADFLRLVASILDGSGSSAQQALAQITSLLQFTKSDVNEAAALLRSVADTPVQPSALAATPLPVLVLHGRDEETSMDRFDTYLPRSLHIVTDGDHGTSPFQADFQQALAQFLAGI
jgi:pimeloyl-ACP methyl ester carboxylesterase